MNKSVIFFVLFTFTYVKAVLQCYKCTTTRPPLHSNETVRLCSEFDYSDKYIVDCPFSTFCTKRAISGKLPNVVNLVERDCANQKYVTQALENGTWRPQVSIEEPYQAGCAPVDDQGLRTTTTVDCYCNSYLCNGQNKRFSSSYYVLLAVSVIVFVNNLNLFKF